MKHKINHLHFIGIGGSGMSGIAEVLLNLGYVVSGSDLQAGAATQRLGVLGARILLGHEAANIAGADAIVVSTAVQADNPEVVAARAAGIPIVPRAQMLAELMRLKQGIAVAGTHGKTTTTSLIASILGEGGFDPTFVIGGRLNAAGANAHLGKGDFLVAEADESDASFLRLSPVISVVTNIDADHMETYGHDFSRLKQAFVDFLERLPFYGVAVLCTDDPNVNEIIPQVTKQIVRYGLNEQANIRAVDVRADNGRMHFTAVRRNGSTSRLPITLNLPGVHYVQNALAAIAVATEVGASDESIIKALGEFRGVGRRFQRYGELPLPKGGAVTVIDDYGHHPVEMVATLAAARGAFPGRRLVLAFQPHRYSRTQAFLAQFAESLDVADDVTLLEIYAASEKPILGVSSELIAEKMQHGIYLPNFIEAAERIVEIAKPGDVILTLGAGDVNSLAPIIADGLAKRFG